MIELNSLWAVFTGVMIIWSAHTAGKFKAAMDFEAAEGNKTDWALFGWWAANLAFAVYFVIALYGYGVERCGV